MADLADIERMLVGRIAAVLFPSITYLPGDTQASAAAVHGTPVRARVVRGWPTKAALDTNLAAGVATVSVFPERGMSRNDSRYLNRPAVVSAAVTATATTTVLGNVVTFGGACGSGQVVGVAIPASGSSLSLTAAYRMSASDTPATVVLALQGLLADTVASGATLTATNSQTVTAGVAVDQVAYQEFRRQKQGVRVTVWAPNPPVRDAVTPLVDYALTFNLRPVAATGEACLVTYSGTDTDDAPGIDNLWRRDLRLMVEYPTSIATTVTQILFATLNLNSAAYGAAAVALNGLTDGNGLLITDGNGLSVVAPQ